MPFADDTNFTSRKMTTLKTAQLLLISLKLALNSENKFDSSF
jgi:hypothetical protein